MVYFALLSLLTNENPKNHGTQSVNRKDLAKPVNLQQFTLDMERKVHTLNQKAFLIS